ncbi:MAG: response regulator [Mariprofundaceae bacterium]
MALVLIADDSTFMRRCVSKIVESAGHKVVQAVNGQQCLEMIAEQNPDCLFLDLVMPELDGFGVLKALQTAGDSRPVIVLSADIQHETKEECKRLGAVAFLNKPPKSDEVLQALQQFLG